VLLDAHAWAQASEISSEPDTHYYEGRKLLWRGGQDVNLVRQSSAAVVFADACPLLREGPEVLRNNADPWTRLPSLQHCVLRPGLLDGGLWAQRHSCPFRFFSEVLGQPFTKLQPSSPEASLHRGVAQIQRCRRFSY
jgi:hypothetical protein